MNLRKLRRIARERTNMTKDISLRDIIAISQLQSLTSVYWGDSDLYSSGKDLVKCQCENAYEYADMMLLERDKTKQNNKETSNELNIINAI